MIRIVFISLISISIGTASLSQIPYPGFEIPDDACIDEQFTISNTSINADSYEWDFCPNDFDILPPESIAAGNLGASFNSFKIINDGNNYYGFGVGSNGSLYRLSFGNSLENMPTVNNLGNLGILNNPEGIDIIFDGSQYVGLIGHNNNSSGFVTRFILSDLEATPVAENIGNLGVNGRIRDLKLIKDGSDFYAFLIGFNENSLVQVSLGSEASGSILPADINKVMNVNSVSLPTGIDLVKKETIWHVLIFSAQTKEVSLLAYNSGLNNSFSFVKSQQFPSFAFARKIKAEYYQNEIIAIASTVDQFHLLNLKELTSADIFEEINNSNFGSSEGVDIVRDSGQYYIFSTNSSLFRFDYEEECNLNSYSEEENPVTSFTSSGTYPITLTAYHPNGNSASLTKEITVTSNNAPLGNLNLNSNYCVTNDISFVFNTTADIVSYNWDFGDGNISTSPSPLHQYSTGGTYYVNLNVESAAGCPNSFYDTLNILPEPQPQFSSTQSEYCTFESIDFSNTTAFNYGSNVIWNWDFNGEGNSSLENPNYTFTTSGIKTITLQANVLGCVDTYQRNITIIDGPNVNFSYDKNCLNETIQFTNLTTGSNITSYFWEFGNGQTSAQENPQAIFNTPGSYSVSLTVTNSSNCENTITKDILLYDQVIESIKFTEPVENIPIEFTIDWDNDFDSTNVISYQWEIDGNVKSTDSATYKLSVGNYTINLEILTGSGCYFNKSQTFDVLPSTLSSPGFRIPNDACIDEQFTISNTSINADSYEWDFCPNDFDILPPESIAAGNLGASFNSFKIINDGNNYYGFGVGSNGSLYRLSFGNSLENMPTVNNLGNLGILNNPEGIDIIFDGSQYVGLIGHNNNSSGFVTRFILSDLEATPVAENIGNLGVNGRIRDLKLIKDGSDFYAFLIGFNENSLVQVSLGSEASGSILPADINKVMNVNSVSLPTGIDLVKKETIWHVLIFSAQTKEVSLLAYNSGLNNSFSFVKSQQFPSFAFARKIKAEYYQNEIIAIASTVDQFHLLNLKELTSADIFEEINNSNFGSSEGVDIVRDSGQYYIFSTNSSLFRFDYQEECNLNSYSEEENPVTSFTSSGTYPITLTAYHPNGNSASLTKEITVTSDVAPEINTLIANSERCIGSTINFEADSPDDISNWLWTFGNGDSANVQNPSYIFDTPGTYEVVVEGESINGCINRRIETIEIYKAPTVTFSRSSQGALCSQKPIQFTNTSSLPTEASFVWDFGDGNTSAEENPEHIYAEAGTYEVALVIEMAGCTSSLSQSVEVNPGPNVNFAEASNCFGQVIEFNNISSGEFITGYSWNFGDGGSSTQQNPVHSYDTPGIKTVELTAFTANGCDYTITEEIEVFPLADVNFTVDPACEGTQVQFNEDISLNNANVADYLWDFGVTGISSDISNLANPLYAYEVAGTYEVRLQVTTEDGCTTFETKTITVSESPEPSISFAPSCLGEAFIFSGNDNDNIENHFWSLKTMEGDELTTSTSPFLTYTFSESGNYIVSYRQETEQLCSKTVEEEITILAPPTAAFTTQNQCVGSTIQLTNNSTLNGNQVSSYKWFLDDELFSTEENPILTTEDAGSVEIRLEVETETACMVSISQTINIANSPNPNFILSSPIVAVPYDLNLSTSLNSGESAKWYINDELISESSNLVQSIDSVGLYFVSLEISNEQGCTETMNKQLSARKPELNITLNNIQAVEGNGFTEFILTLSNKGSLVPDYYNLSLNFGEYSVTERLETEILPEKLKNERLSVQLSSDQLRGIDRICIEAIAVKGAFEESNITDNRSCINITSDFKVLPVYPNPSRKNITIPIILPQSGMVEFLVEQSDGKTAQQFNQSLEAGYNEIVLSKADLKEGIYFIRIRYNQKEDVRKIVFY